MAQIRSKQIADFLASVNWSNVTANDIANAADIDARFSVVEANVANNGSDLQDSVDSIESALSAEIVATNADVDANNDSIDSLESALSTELVDRAVADAAEKTSRESVDAVLSTAIVNETTSRESVDTVLSNAIVTADGRRIDGDQSLEEAIASLEGKHDSEMTVHHDEHLSLIAAEELRATTEEGYLADSVDSLESALSTEIVDRIADVNAEETRALAAEASLTTRVANEEAARLAGDTYAMDTVIGFAGVAMTQVAFNTTAAFAGGVYDLEVRVNGLPVENALAQGSKGWFQVGPQDFELVLGYDLEATDRITVNGVAL